MKSHIAIGVRALCVGGVAFAALGCESYDLAEKPPIEISVASDNPTWEGGIQQILALKCDNCHAKAPSKFAPENVRPYAFGFSESETRFVSSYAALAKHSVFDNAADPMPPDFGTPLTANEKAALKSYFDRVIATAPTNGDCPTTTSLTFAGDIKGIVDASCSGSTCHATPGTVAGVSVALRSVDDFKAANLNAIVSQRPLEKVKSGSMPMNDSGFRSRAEGARLTEWLCASPELK